MDNVRRIKDKEMMNHQIALSQLSLTASKKSVCLVHPVVFPVLTAILVCFVLRISHLILLLNYVLKSVETGRNMLWNVMMGTI